MRLVTSAVTVKWMAVRQTDRQIINLNISQEKKKMRLTGIELQEILSHLK